jgi:hypothetical protein
MNTNLQRLQNELADSLLGLDAAQTQLCPPARSGCWSIQQIVSHLMLTYSATEVAISARLAKRTPTKARPTIQQRVGQYTLIKLGYFPNGRKAPVTVAPGDITLSLSGEELTQSTAEQLAHLDDIFNQAEQLFGAGRCASHMVLGPLSINQWRRFQLIHGGHHVKQILAIRKACNI